MTQILKKRVKLFQFLVIPPDSLLAVVSLTENPTRDFMNFSRIPDLSHHRPARKGQPALTFCVLGFLRRAIDRWQADEREMASA